MAITDDLGVEWVEDNDIQRVFVDYFSGLFTINDNLDMDAALETVDNRVSEVILDALSQPFTKEENQGIIPYASL
ncbi:hypothetical protein ACS0TY_033827 [Phlomoides rotata]